MSRFGSCCFNSNTKAPTLAGRNLAFSHPIFYSPIFIKDILLIIKKVGNFTLKNPRRIPENCGRILENCDRILEFCGRIPGNCGRIPGNCGRIPENCDRILENCGSFLGNCQGFRVKYEGLFKLKFVKTMMFERTQTLSNSISL